LTRRGFERRFRYGAHDRASPTITEITRMKPYLVLTAVVFGLLTTMHIWRVFAESMSLAKDPFFVILTLISFALCLWAIRLIVVGRRGENATMASKQ
jgi:hypothetical protein